MDTLFQEAKDIDAELSLSTGVILSLFFGITLVSAVFFGMGYSFGVTHGVTADTLSLHGLLHGSAQSGPASTISANSATTQVVPAAPVQSTTPADSAAMQAASAPADASVAMASEQSSSAVLGDPIMHTPARATTAIYMVQIAASASRQDAQFLIAKLHRSGLHARLHHAVQDRFFRVQIGPFASRSDAIAMRNKALAAGFKAILKSNH